MGDVVRMINEAVETARQVVLREIRNIVDDCTEHEETCDAAYGLECDCPIDGGDVVEALTLYLKENQ